VVELDLFSGRPNPQWRLSGSARDRLLALLRAALPTHESASEPGLGYRGFIVRIISGERMTRVHIGEGAIEIDGARGRDEGRGIEKLLMQSMPDELRTRFGSTLPRLP
jgi:hypothetical protein